MTTVQTPSPKFEMTAGPNLNHQIAGGILLLHALMWGLFLFRWITFGSLGWDAFEFENGLATFAPIIAYVVYGVGLIGDACIGTLLTRDLPPGRMLGIVRSVVWIILGAVFWWLTGDFYGFITLAGIAGMLLLLLFGNVAWSVNYPAAFWLVVFFVLPNVIVFLVSFADRGRLGTIAYPNIIENGILSLFDDYARFFSQINGRYLYLRIFWRSVWMATVNTMICLLLGYPFAYWIARQPKRWRNVLIFMVMIPFWTNFLVRTFALMSLLRRNGLINNLWTGAIHNMMASLAEGLPFLQSWADATAEPLPLLFNQGAVFVGLLYGFFPFVVLPLYANLERLDWRLLEAAADLGANSWQSTIRVLLPLSTPGIVAAGIIVFIPSLGAYVTPDLLGGGQVSLLGNLLQQQFMTARDWPFGSAIGFIMMVLMLISIMIYFRIGGDRR